ncbi:MAG TPA: hypothetical protein DEF00_04335 [Candidatus Taylorbacteria bacterium]|nr:hypothetical protein [Candidatus Taylorbacteria bacterium]
MLFAGFDIFSATRTEKNLGASPFFHPLSDGVFEGFSGWCQYVASFVFCFHILDANLQIEERMPRMCRIKILILFM